MKWLILAAAAPAANPTATSAAGWAQIVPFVLMIGVFYFFMIMPQKKQQKQRQAMLDGLKKGDKIITMGGIHGEITELDNENIKLRISEKVEIKCTRASIANVK